MSAEEAEGWRSQCSKNAAGISPYIVTGETDRSKFPEGQVHLHRDIGRTVLLHRWIIFVVFEGHHSLMLPWLKIEQWSEGTFFTDQFGLRKNKQLRIKWKKTSMFVLIVMSAIFNDQKVNSYSLQLTNYSFVLWSN